MRARRSPSRLPVVVAGLVTAAVFVSHSPVGSAGLLPLAAPAAKGTKAKPSGRGSAAVPVSAQSTSQAAAVSTSAMRRNQIVRVGLTLDRERITLACPGGFRVIDPADGAPIWKESFRESLTVGIRGARPTEGRMYRAQVGSFESKETAEELAEKLRRDLSELVVVAWVPDRRTWRIRVGASATREGLGPLLERLRAAGYADAWVTDEALPQDQEARLVLLDTNYDSYDVAAKLMEVQPLSSGSHLSVNGASYRGTLEVRLDVSGALRVVNVIPIESYLRGVVPSELGPALYPEIEALKAQTVAARTYTYRNLGQFSDEGYDLCDTPRCQVYGGVKAEHPLSDRAIQETEGVIAVHEGRPINALYTSTCGGHTEDASEIFPEDAAPYLTGVPCAPEERSLRVRRIALTGSSALVESRAASEAEAAALLAIHGLLPKSALDPAVLEGQPTSEETDRWIQGVVSACGARPMDENAAGSAQERAARGGTTKERSDTKKREAETSRETSESGEPAIGPYTAAALARKLIDRLGWGARVDLIIGQEGADSWFPDEPEGLGEDEMEAVAYFLREKSWPEGPRGGPEPLRIATRGDFARLLLAAVRSCDLLRLDEGLVRGGDPRSLSLSGDDGRSTRPLSSEAMLFADFGAGPVPVRRLGVVTGDKIRYHVDREGRIDNLLLLPGRKGVSDDRFSTVSTWEVAYSAEDLARKLADQVGSGKLIDIVPVRRGVSGRVTEVRIVGSSGQAVIRGFRIRTALGLRENLFRIDRQRDESGALRRIVFTGRGWGHGLGLCQIGAYGMALRGESYQKILTHYYSGITLETLP